MRIYNPLRPSSIGPPCETPGGRWWFVWHDSLGGPHVEICNNKEEYEKTRDFFLQWMYGQLG